MTTPREAVRVHVRSWLSDQVEVGPDYTDEERKRAEQLRLRLPTFHDQWAEDFTRDLLRALAHSDKPTFEATYDFVRSSLVEPRFDDETPEEVAQWKADDDRFASDRASWIVTVLAKAGYEVKR